MRILRIVILVLAIALLALSTLSGLLMNYLYIFLMASAMTMLVSTIIAALRKQLYWGIWRRQAGAIIYVGQAVLRTICWIILGIAIQIAIVPIQFPGDSLRVLNFLIWGSVAALYIFAWLPRKQIGHAVNLTLLLFAISTTFQIASIYLPPPNSDRGVTLMPPFQQSWYVVQGGNSPLINHHYYADSQRYALDVLLPEDGKLPLEQVTNLAEYQTFGSELFAPIDGAIAKVENSLPDVAIGEFDRNNLAGNHIVIQTQDNKYVMLAHLQKDSVAVKVGDRVTAGQPIAKCGNSGNTSQPHLHIQAMTDADFLSPNSKPLPIFFAIANEPPKFFKRNEAIAGFSS